MWLQAISSVFIGVSVCHSLEVELLHVRPLEAARLLLAAKLVDATLEVAALAGGTLPAGVPLATLARAAPSDSPLAELNHLWHGNKLINIALNVQCQDNSATFLDPHWETDKNCKIHATSFALLDFLGNSNTRHIMYMYAVSQ